MSSPILALQHNITYKFEHINEYSSELFRKYVTDGVVKPGIIWNSSNDFFFPRVYTKKGEMEVSEKFLEFIWILIFSHWVLYEEDHMKSEINATHTNALIINKPLIDKAKKLRVICKTHDYLKNGWDRSLPNPETVDPLDKFFVEKVNGIFQDSIALFLNHELGHIVLKHKPYTDISHEESVEQEKEADNFALQAYLDGKEGDASRVQSGLAVLFTYFSPLFTTSHPENLKKNTHPDTDVRFYNALERVGFSTDQECYYFYKLALTLIHDFLADHQTFLTMNGLSFPSEPVETAKDLFEVYVDLLEQAKILTN